MINKQDNIHIGLEKIAARSDVLAYIRTRPELLQMDARSLGEMSVPVKMPKPAKAKVYNFSQYKNRGIKPPKGP